MHHGSPRCFLGAVTAIPWLRQLPKCRELSPEHPPQCVVKQLRSSSSKCGIDSDVFLPKTLETRCSIPSHSRYSNRILKRDQKGVRLLQKRNLPRSVSMRAQQCCPGPGVPSGRGALCTPQLLRAVGSWVSRAQHKRWMWRGTKGLFAFLKHQRVPPAPPHIAHRSPATPNPIPCSQRTETNVQTPIFTHSDTRIQIFGHQLMLLLSALCSSQAAARNVPSGGIKGKPPWLADLLEKQGSDKSSAG